MGPGRTWGRLTPRQRRGVGLIAVSVFALATPPGVYPTMYDFATVSVGWAVVARPIETTVFRTVDGASNGSFRAASVGATPRRSSSSTPLTASRSPATPTGFIAPPNAGSTWQQIAPMAPAAGRFALHVIDSQHAWAQNSTFMTHGGGGFQVSAVVVTSDGGLSWTGVVPPQVS